MPTVKLTDVRSVRAALGVSQSKAATLLGVSTKAVQSYEQGSRSVPSHVQRMAAVLLYARWRQQNPGHAPCWEITGCAPEVCRECPALKFKMGDLCWMLTGTMCKGRKMQSSEAKLAECQKCDVMRQWLKSSSKRR